MTSGASTPSSTRPRPIARRPRPGRGDGADQPLLGAARERRGRRPSTGRGAGGSGSAAGQPVHLLGGQRVAVHRDLPVEGEQRVRGEQAGLQRLSRPPGSRARSSTAREVRSRPRLRGHSTSTSWAASAPTPSSSRLTSSSVSRVIRSGIRSSSSRSSTGHASAARRSASRRGCGPARRSRGRRRRRSTAGRRRRSGAGPARRAPGARPGPTLRPAPPRRPRSGARSAPAGRGSRGGGSGSWSRRASRSGRRAGRASNRAGAGALRGSGVDHGGRGVDRGRHRQPPRTGRRRRWAGRQWPSAGSNRPAATIRSPARAAGASADGRVGVVRRRAAAPGARRGRSVTACRPREPDDALARRVGGLEEGGAGDDESRRGPTLTRGADTTFPAEGSPHDLNLTSCSPAIPSSTGTTTCSGRRASGSATTSTGSTSAPAAPPPTPICRGCVAGGVGGAVLVGLRARPLPGDAAVTADAGAGRLVHQLVERYPDRLALATTADEVEAAWRAGRIASLLGAEGGHSIDCSLGALRMLHAARRPLPDAHPQRQHPVGRLGDRRARRRRPDAVRRRGGPRDEPARHDGRPLPRRRRRRCARRSTPPRRR